MVLKETNKKCECQGKKKFTSLNNRQLLWFFSFLLILLLFLLLLLFLFFVLQVWEKYLIFVLLCMGFLVLLEESKAIINRNTTCNSFRNNNKYLKVCVLSLLNFSNSFKVRKSLNKIKF